MSCVVDAQLTPPRRCIAIYVRHGDKGSEMSLRPFSEYASAAELLWQRGLVGPPGATRGSGAKDQKQEK